MTTEQKQYIDWINTAIDNRYKKWEQYKDLQRDTAEANSDLQEAYGSLAAGIWDQRALLIEARTKFIEIMNVKTTEQ